MMVFTKQNVRCVHIRDYFGEFDTEASPVPTSVLFRLNNLHSIVGGATNSPTISQTGAVGALVGIYGTDPATAGIYAFGEPYFRDSYASYFARYIVRACKITVTSCSTDIVLATNAAAMTTGLSYAPAGTYGVAIQCGPGVAAVGAQNVPYLLGPGVPKGIARKDYCLPHRKNTLSYTWRLPSMSNDSLDAFWQPSTSTQNAIGATDMVSAQINFWNNLIDRCPKGSFTIRFKYLVEWSTAVGVPSS